MVTIAGPGGIRCPEVVDPSGEAAQQALQGRVPDTKHLRRLRLSIVGSEGHVAVLQKENESKAYGLFTCRWIMSLPVILDSF